MYPEVVDTTPGSLSKGGSMHQKQPPAKVAVASADAAVGGACAGALGSVASVASMTASSMSGFPEVGTHARPSFGAARRLARMGLISRLLGAKGRRQIARSVSAIYVA